MSSAPNKIIVNGVDTNLPDDQTLTFGGVTVRRGVQNVEWKGEGDRTHGTKITAPNGFSAMLMGGYCGAMEVNVPTRFFGKMLGLCGTASGTRSNDDYKSAKGAVMDVKRGQSEWEKGGYGGPNSAMSLWQKSWKPCIERCLFRGGCSPAAQHLFADGQAHDKDTEVSCEAPTFKAATKAAIQTQDAKIDAWLETPEGIAANKFCIGLGIQNKRQIYRGCLEVW